jgi:hypothetical protein
MARVRPLRSPTIPIAGESARSLFCRAAGGHGVPLSFTILRHLGMQYRNVVTIAEDQHLDVHEMARIIKVDANEIEARRYRPVGSKRYSFFGLELPTAAIEKKVRRFAPASLAISPHIRAEWELRDLPFCAESWDMLTDRCTCRVVQGWIRLNRGVHRCDDCGRDLSMIEVTKVPSHLRDQLSFYAGLVSPLRTVVEEAVSSLPPAIRQAERAALFQCVKLLRRAVAGRNADPARDLEALHAACAAILDWPIGIAALSPANATPASAWSATLSAYRQLRPGRTSNPDTESTQARPATKDGGGGDGAPRGCDLIGIRPAYELARLTPETLRAGRRFGHLGDHYRLRGVKQVEAFRPDEVELFADAVRERLTTEAAGYRLGVGGRAIRDMVASGHMTASGIQLTEDEVILTDQDVQDLIDGLMDGSILSEPVPLRTALMFVSGRPKPWGTLIGELLAGALPFQLADGDGRLFDRLQIERRDIPTICALEARPPSRDERITTHEALEIMNADQRSGALRSIISTGRNPVTYLLADVVDLAVRGITVLEIATTSGETLSWVYHRLKNRSVSLVTKDLYCRRSVRALAALEPRLMRHQACGDVATATPL